MRLTIEEIENIRRNGVHAISFSERTDKVIELCDLALQSLSQESVRSEAEPVAWQIIGRASGEVISLTSDEHEIKLAVEAGHLIRGLYLRALLSPARVAEQKDVHSTELRK